MITHTSDSHQIPSQNKTKLQILKNCQKFKFCKNRYMQHTFWSCLIRCINRKWIQPELKALQSWCGTDGRSETNKPPPPPNNFVVRGGIITFHRIIKDVITYPCLNPSLTFIVSKRGLRTSVQGSTLSFLAGCPKSHFLGWYRNFHVHVYSYLKLDNQVVNWTCPKDKLGWIWRADDPLCRTLQYTKLWCHPASSDQLFDGQWKTQYILTVDK